MLLFILIVMLVVVYMTKTVIKPKNYPPGPQWYPFFGCNNIIHAKAIKFGSQYKALQEMAKEYRTQVLGLKMGSDMVVAVFGEKNIRFVCNDLNFDARPESFFIKLRTFGKKCGITFVDGPLWREHRHFVMKCLRKEGFAKEVMESDIQAKTEKILEILKNSNGTPVNIRFLVAMAVTNILWKYVAGEHLRETQLHKFILLMSKRSEVFTMAGGWLNQWPWLRFIAPNWSGFSIIQKMNSEMFEIIHESIRKHREGKVKGSDYIYKFMNEMYRESFTEDQLRGVLVDFLIASTQTTGSIIGFAIISLIRNKDIYDKIYNEINMILGKNPPKAKDCTRLVYTSAFLYEILRKFTIAPFSGPRRTLKDTIIDGYNIPKGTTILISLDDLHSSSEIWNDPEQLIPERFIDENGVLKNTNKVYPFGLGRRACPGEPLSKSFIFIFIVSIIQKYKIECSDGEMPSDEPIIGILTEPKPFTARFIERPDA
ncbi:cytochrome P450 Cyp305B1 precursor [Danaus plexippus plexippus]|uniref:Cytochrome P450 Cyp305B1 n=1 Tax=Danaus plexippus plexippus TaxID=278856 RepID=A0A212EMN8_DANPL|nr:cytochrome P450 Cyp305B1 precursor [Danaus plexippus plexippus]